MCCLIENSSIILVDVATRCLGRCVSMHWELTFRNLNGIGQVSERVQHDLSRVFQQYLLSPLGLESESKGEVRPLEVFYRAGNDTGALDLE